MGRNGPSVGNASWRGELAVVPSGHQAGGEALCFGDALDLDGDCLDRCVDASQFLVEQVEGFGLGARIEPFDPNAGN